METCDTFHFALQYAVGSLALARLFYFLLKAELEAKEATDLIECELPRPRVSG